MKDGGSQALDLSLFFPKSSSGTESNRTGTWSFMRPRYLEKTAPCSVRCPCGQDIPRVEMLVSRGVAAEAARTLIGENPLPGVCGRVCFHPCEEACNRGQFDEAVSVHAIERYVADILGPSLADGDLSLRPALDRSVAVVGSGPAGLSAAYFLARLGYECDLYEAQPEPGGLLRYGIPAYRLPEEALRREVARIRSLGVHLRCSVSLGPDFLERASDRYDAVFVACGNGAPQRLGIPGEDCAVDALSFLKAMRGGEEGIPSLTRGGRAVVLGGGNSAVDVARSLVRLGVAPTIVYRRRREDMPAFSEELQRAREEGVEILELRAPVAASRKGGRIELSVRKMRPAGLGEDGRMRVVPEGEATESLVADYLFSAIGAKTAAAWLSPPEGVRVMNLSHCAACWETAWGLPVLYGGDPVIPSESVADAIASGKQAALAIDAYFEKGLSELEAELARSTVGTGPSLSMELYLGGPRSARAKKTVAAEDLNLDYFERSKAGRGPAKSPALAVSSFEEVEGSLGSSEAVEQAERCFNCGICNDCDNCRTFCPEAAVLADRAGRGREWLSEAGPARRVNSDYCKGCGVCVAECPRSAMVIEEQQS